MSGNTKEETEQQFVSAAPVEGENGKKRTVFRGELAHPVDEVIVAVFKIAVMILGLPGLANMWMAVFADTGVAMICVLNSIRALYIK